jgi:octaprenyl-diphosphate synthase
MQSRLDIIKGELADVRQCMNEQLTGFDEPVNELLEHIRARCGKMLRPAMLLLTAKICGPITPNHITLAAIVELIHTATLLHDDVIDEADSRRNAATANTLWGNESAVLLGDLLLSRVFAMCGRLESLLFIRELGDTTVRICHGELMQNMQRQNWQLTEKQYLAIVNDKTASLFTASCRLGCLDAAKDKDYYRALSDFGTNIGMAFQINDDLLDIVGDEEAIGKTLGTDLAKRKPTLPVIHLLSNASASEKLLLIEQLSTRPGPQQLLQMLENSGSLEYTRNLAQKFSNDAVNSLKPLRESSAKDALIEIAQLIAARCA